VSADMYIVAVPHANCQGPGGVLCIEVRKVLLLNRGDRSEFPEGGY
jgi:hypothetical protein